MALKIKKTEQSTIDTGNYTLNVKRSFLGKAWKYREFDELQSMAISQKYDLPEILGRIISARKIELENVQHFLKPTLRELLPNPNILRDMDKASDRIIKAINDNDKIAIFGDYDVDGATSSAILDRFFKSINFDNLTIYIPDRITEGYGPNKEAIEGLINEGASLIITVDCGVSATDAINLAKEKNTDIIVLDHHSVKELLPDAYAIVNPNREDDISDMGDLAAVGVVYLTIIAINTKLRNEGYYKDNNIDEPNLINLLDLVALGTICDVVPLSYLNRAFVNQGLKIMSRNNNLGLDALFKAANISSPISSYHLGFMLGPRINAGGRIGKSELGVNLLTTDNQLTASEIANSLNKLNIERQQIERKTLEEAEHIVLDENKHLNNLIIIAKEGWHKGVLGLVASRITEKYHRPTLILTIDKDENIATGSARSITAINIGKLVNQAVEIGLLIKGGGHKMAAGLSLEPDKIKELELHFNNEIENITAGDYPKNELKIDGALMSNSVTAELIDTINKASPFGQNNPEPLIVFPAHRLFGIRQVGEHHLRATLSSDNGKSINAIAFNVVDNELGKNILKHQYEPMHIVGYLKKDYWRGQVQLRVQIRDAASIS